MSYENLLSGACEEGRHEACDPKEVVKLEDGYCSCKCHECDCPAAPFGEHRFDCPLRKPRK